MHTEESNTQLLNAYRTDGFAALPGFIGGDELDQLIANVDRFISEIVPNLPPEDAFYEERSDPKTLKQIQKMDVHDEWFHGLVTGRVRQIAELLLDGPVVPRNLQYFNKPPSVGRATPAHQDGYYFMLKPCEAVTMWLALDDVDEENGCVRYIRGSHKRGMRQHSRTTTLGFSQGITDFPTGDDEEHEIALPARSGDLLVHDAMTIHRADANRSPTRTRKALGFVYYSERAREDTEAHAAYQRKLTREMKESGMI